MDTHKRGSSLLKLLRDFIMDDKKAWVFDRKVSRYEIEAALWQGKTISWADLVERIKDLQASYFLLQEQEDWKSIAELYMKEQIQEKHTNNVTTAIGSFKKALKELEVPWMSILEKAVGQHYCVALCARSLRELQEAVEEDVRYKNDELALIEKTKRGILNAEKLAKKKAPAKKKAASRRKKG